MFSYYCACIVIIFIYVIYCHILFVFLFLKWTLLVWDQICSILHMADKDINEEILKNIRGKSQNNLNEILRNFTDTDFEVQIFDDSSYIDIDSMRDNLKPHEKSFSLMSLNIQSINAKFDNLKTLLSYLKESHFMFRPICLQETWLRSDQDTSLFEIPGYNLIHKGKSYNEHGGLIIYLKEDFTYNYSKLSNQSKLWGGLFIDQRSYKEKNYNRKYL